MSDPREHLKTMIVNLIKGDESQASVDMHSYLVPKMKELAGLGAPQTDVPEPPTGTEND